VPGYEILGELGRGGMGVVYKARQIKADRLVALKMVLHAGHADAEALARFKTEAEAVARLTHPNIVQVYEVGEYDGLPFFSLEFCAGGSLDRRLKQPLPAREAASLISALARAVQAAHDAGVIHRDLKPANILLASGGRQSPEGGDATPDSGDGRPPLAGLIPKIADFGLARKIDEAGRTHTGQVMGTPSYMAPEQAAGRTHQLGPTADIYALGAILYDCLTGRPPFRAATVMETLQLVLSAEPVPPRTLQPGLPRDLETICLKCLHKEPEQRYRSAAALADDLQHYLNGEPITARPVGALERTWRWCRRNPAVASLLATVFVLLLVGSTVASILAVRASRKATEAESARAQERQRAEAERLARAEAETEKEQAHAARQTALSEKGRADEQAEQSRRSLSNAQLLLADKAWDENNPGRALRELDAVPAQLRSFEWRYRQRLFHGDLFTVPGSPKLEALSADGRRLFARNRRGLHVLDPDTGAERTTLDNAPDCSLAALSPDETLLAVGYADGRVRLLDSGTGREVWAREPLPRNDGQNNNIAGLHFSPDGRLLAVVPVSRNLAWVRDVGTGQLLRTLSVAANLEVSLQWSPDGRTMAVRGRWPGVPGSIQLWDTDDWHELPPLPVQGNSEALAFAFSPDGRRIAFGDETKVIRLRDVRQGGELLRLTGGCEGGLTFSPDGRRLAAVESAPSRAGTPILTGRVWDTKDGRELFRVSGAGGLVFSPDGRRLAGIDAEHRIREWDAWTGRELAVRRGHTGIITALTYSPDGCRLLSSSYDGTIRVWGTQDVGWPFTLPGQGKPVSDLAYNPEGTVLATATGNVVSLWDVRTGQRLPTQVAGNSDFINAVRYSPDGKALATAGRDGTVRLWDAQTGAERVCFRGHQKWVGHVAFSADGRRLVSGGLDNTARVWDIGTGKQLLVLGDHRQQVSGVAFSPDGRRVYTASGDRMLREWDAWNGQLLRILGAHNDHIWGMALSPDGRLLASAGFDMTVRLWDTETGTELLTMRGHAGALESVCFSPDGEHLASVSRDRTVRLWDVRTGRQTLTLTPPLSAATRVCFSPDGNHLAANADAVVRFWDARPTQERLTIEGNVSRISDAAFSPDGTRLVLTWDRAVRVCDARTGKPFFTCPGGDRGIGRVGFSPGGDRFAGDESGGKVLQWDARTGQPLPNAAPFPFVDASRSPDGKTFAWVNGDVVRLIDLQLSPDERAYRLAVTRTDFAWHAAEAQRWAVLDPWAGAFHRAHADPSTAAAWPELRRSVVLAGAGRRREAVEVFCVAVIRGMPSP
jgi:WD40 repeat protein